MSIGRIMASIFILGFGTIFGLGHLLWGVLRFIKEDSHKPISWSILNFDKMDYDTAPSVQLILLGAISIVGVLVWYFYVFRSW